MLTTTTQHALRALIHIARMPEGQPVLGRDLAKSASIPANYLSKILLSLGNAGIVEATRGHGGGYRLARPARRIALVEVVRLFEGVHSEPGCLLGEARECSDDNPCSAHASWKKVRAAYLDFLTKKTIADIAAHARGHAAANSRPKK